MLKLIRSDIAGESTYFWGGWLGLVSHPIYWFIWTYWFPQPYESTILRFFCSALSIPVILRHHWPEKTKQFFPAYWFIFLMCQLPITFSYLTLQNDFSGVWLVCETLMVIVVSIFHPNLLLFLSNLLIGAAIAYGLYFFTAGQHVAWHQEHLMYFLPLPIGVVFTMVFSYTIKQERIKQEEIKSKLLQSLAGSIAHEMRNPLAQIQGSLELIQMQSPDLNKNQYLRNAYKVIQNGLQVIDLTMDAIAEKPIDTASFKLLSALDLARESVADFAYREAEHANRVSVTGGDFKFMGDPVMVKYVLYNLITNALYYVKVLPHAEIIISVMPDTNGVNQIEVRDTGPGIAPDAIPKLFDSFYTSDKQGGTGLGLSYCKRTMTALGGDIHCESELGKYTAFTLSFPKVSEDQVSTEKVSNMDKLPTTKSEYLAGKTLLIAEDDRTSRMIVKSILDRQGIQCLEAENGQEALNLLAEYHCDLMLTDMQMPIMNGLKLIETIRQRETIASGNPLPIIALTSQEGDILNTAIKLGINDYLIKPVSVEGLVPKLQQLLAS